MFRGIPVVPDLKASKGSVVYKAKKGNKANRGSKAYREIRAKRVKTEKHLS